MNGSTDEAEWASLLRSAEHHLRSADPILGGLIERIGPCRLAPDRQPFVALIASIISQQISVKAARAIRARVEALLDGEPRPDRILALDHETLRSAGLSNSKAHYLRDLAERAASGSLDLDNIRALPDEAVIGELVQVKGIGRWTAEMFLIFSAGRLDVLPVDDLGLRTGVRNHYGLASLPGRAEIEPIAECWRPYRSIATWYLWRSLNNEPA